MNKTIIFSVINKEDHLENRAVELRTNDLALNSYELGILDFNEEIHITLTRDEVLDLIKAFGSFITLTSSVLSRNQTC
jgi:hypothetical protein